MRTRKEAVKKANELNEAEAWATRRFYSVDQSPMTGAWRVVVITPGYFQQVVAS